MRSGVLSYTLLTMREILGELVAIPSMSGQEQVVAGYVAERCQAPRRTTIIGDSVAVHIPGEDSKKAIFFNGHIDTVPPTEQWGDDPFTLHTDSNDDDRLIGLGASDMKAGVAIMIDITDETREQKPPCDLWLLFSSREETDSSGSVQIADWLAEEIQGRYDTTGGLILEPTNAEFVGVGHRGDTLWEVAARGPGGHVSRDFIGAMPAIEKVANVVAALPQLRREWTASYTDPVLGSPSINPTIINGGSTANVVPAEASLAINLRITPQLAADLSEVRASLERSYGLEISQAWEPNPTLCGQNEHIYKVVKGSMPAATFRAFPGATDQFAFHAHNMPMLIYGPGDVEAMHQPDEWIRYSAMAKCKDMITLIMKHF